MLQNALEHALRLLLLISVHGKLAESSVSCAELMISYRRNFGIPYPVPLWTWVQVDVAPNWKEPLLPLKSSIVTATGRALYTLITNSYACREAISCSPQAHAQPSRLTACFSSCVSCCHFRDLASFHAVHSIDTALFMLQIPENLRRVSSQIMLIEYGSIAIFIPFLVGYSHP